MIKVKNQKSISALSKKSLKANRTRNLIAVAAIVLTTVLFTSLFTIALTLGNSFEQATFRQVGGDSHGTFKNVTEEQISVLAADPMVDKSATKLTLGVPREAPFNKTPVEVSYMDKNCAEGYFCKPTTGSLPKEGTNQIACDTRLLKLLGVEPKIGAPIKLTYELGAGTLNPQNRTGDFVLSGWWEFDEAAPASHAIVPLSYARDVLSTYDRQDKIDTTGRWDLNVYLKSSANIEKDMLTILANNGFQNDEHNADNYISIGVNWAYLGAQLAGNADGATIASIFGLLLLIILTGYLIIYNIFQISVSNDIRFYGLLKTIGTTGRQIRKIVRRQALLLALIGIPIGLMLGYLCGNILTPVIMSTLNYDTVYATANPIIFIVATLFSLVTVLVSCSKPGRLAGKVSPIEAVRYTEGQKGRKKLKKSKGGAGLASMAWSNLGRNKKKSWFIVLSLSLAVVLLQVTYTFTNGFDMDKYLRNFVVSDFVLGHADYFQVGKAIFDEDIALSEDSIKNVEAQGGIKESGRIYGASYTSQEFITKDCYRKNYSGYSGLEGSDQIEQRMKLESENEAGLITDEAAIYGMENFLLDQLEVIDGDLGALKDPSQKAIAAVYLTDDYNKPHIDSNWAKVGDKVTLRHNTEWEYYDIRTGKVPAEGETVDESYMARRSTKYQDVTYTVAACVTMRYSMSFRYYGSDEFILNSEVFKQDTGRDDIMTYMFNTTPDATDKMEGFLGDYTTKIDPNLGFESKTSYTDEFESLRGMFMLMGGTLSGIIALVGILNFFNGVLTSIMARRREFAMLQAIGMTGKQLKKMLIYEGLYYALLVIVFSMVVSLAAGPLLDNAMSSMFWFFSYKFTILPVLLVSPVFLLLGFILPVIIYRFIAKQTVVERLREAE